MLSSNWVWEQVQHFSNSSNPTSLLLSNNMIPKFSGLKESLYFALDFVDRILIGAQMGVSCLGFSHSCNLMLVGAAVL